MAEKLTLLLVGGQMRHLAGLRDFLAEHDFAVDLATIGSGAAITLDAAKADLLVLDLGTASPKALALARRFRSRFDLPLLVIGERSDATFRLVANEGIADDFLTRPYDRRELLARIRLTLRRALAPQWPAPREGGAILFDGWAMDLRKRRLAAPSGQEITLTPIEFDLLATFARYPNRVITRETLMREVRDRAWSPLSRAIDVHVGHLRRKVEADPRQPQLIKTIHGVGYIFTPQEVTTQPLTTPAPAGGEGEPRKAWA